MKQTLNFKNTEVAFSLKSNKELKWAYYLFRLIGSRNLTAMAKPVTNFLLRIKFPIDLILKRTVFKQFCGGESVSECGSVIKKMYAKNEVHSILDYSVEGKQNELQFNTTLETLLNVFRFSTHSSATPFIVFKATGLGRFELLEKVSKGEKLMDFEIQEWKRIVGRFDKICSVCASTKNIRAMIDAEESWIQNAIDQLAEEMMFKYNKKRVVVFNTAQLYRWDRLEYLEHLYEKASTENFLVGIKLVRGAYMEKERRRAESFDYKSPICKNKKSTDDNFNNGLLYCLRNLKVFEIFLGTHNETSNLLLTELMKDSNLNNDDNRIWFGQLYGMSDHVSFNLAAHDYNVAKYLPFGPVKEVIPYLLRRAEENTSVGTQTSRELDLIREEKYRRAKTDFKYGSM